MKILLNWRYYIIAILFNIGALVIARMFSEPADPVSDAQLMTDTCISLSVAASCFYLMAMLIKRWERQGVIPEFSDTDIE